MVSYLMASEVIEPEEPQVPEVTVKEGKSSNAPHRVDVIFANGKLQRGKIVLPSSVIHCTVLKKGHRSIKEIAIKKIKKIEIQTWQGEKRGKGAYVFYPSLITVYMKDKQMIQSPGALWELKKFRFITKGSTQKLYSYFYDYRIKNQWKYSKKEDLSYPEKNPPGDVVKTIVFLRDEKDSRDDLKKIFRIFKDAE